MPLRPHVGMMARGVCLSGGGLYAPRTFRRCISLKGALYPDPEGLFEGVALPGGARRHFGLAACTPGMWIAPRTPRRCTSLRGALYPDPEDLLEGVALAGGRGAFVGVAALHWVWLTHQQPLDPAGL